MFQEELRIGASEDDDFAKAIANLQMDAVNFPHTGRLETKI